MEKEIPVSNGSADAINVTSGGLIRFRGSQAGNAATNTAAQAYAQIGHGGHDTSGSHTGAININSGALTLEGGLSNQTYAPPPTRGDAR